MAYGSHLLKTPLISVRCADFFNSKMHSSWETRSI
uniref:Zinc finger protein n=1 Tax=Siphoviridae sp. ctVif31 TaxID=2825532 RepID=A0A8S5Q2J9_9CAUD|nr:MAG TPA: zinc finger protein [Siphoviridae sp. ctVif31]